MQYVIKTEVRAPEARTFTFREQKTMYGGKRIAVGDEVFLFASENEGGRGLVARGVVTSAVPVPRRAGVARQTPLVTVTVRRTAKALRPLGRAELKRHTAWGDGRPETELNFKFYRQATNKIGGISDGAAAFLAECFRTSAGAPLTRRATAPPVTRVVADAGLAALPSGPGVGRKRRARR